MQRFTFFSFFVKIALFLLATLAITLATASCKGSQSPEAATLDGRWIEATGRGDTLIFRVTLLEVKRGFEVRNGQRFSKIGSGLWTYKLGDKYQMSVELSSSSLFNPQTAHVEIKDKILYVSNFYEKENTKYELRAFNKN